MAGIRFTIDQIKNSACAKLNQHVVNGPGQKKAGKAKYRNEKVYWNGEVFDSRKEYKEYRRLLILQKAGLIGQLRRQVKYELIEAVREAIIGKRGKPLKRMRTIERKTEYWADFVYVDSESGVTVVADTKSEATRKLPTYVIKRKLMLERYNIAIKEV